MLGLHWRPGSFGGMPRSPLHGHGGRGGPSMESWADFDFGWIFGWLDFGWIWLGFGWILVDFASLWLISLFILFRFSMISNDSS